ncbi:MAG: hypothetical protein ACR2PB_04115 [Desulfocapsaceae bacterium]
MSNQTPLSADPGAICFGLSPELDRQSCAAYLQLLGQAELAQTLSSRLSEQEIEELIELTSALMRKHLSKHEYHSLFLGEKHTHHNSDNQ